MKSLGIAQTKKFMIKQNLKPANPTKEVEKMNADNNELLLRVLSSIFENFAFMFVEEASELDFESPGECFKAKIEFNSRSKKGFLEVVAPVDFCDETAENILGTEMEELPKDAGENALKELLNIFCGFFLAERFGTDEIFDLSIPETSRIPSKDWGLLVNNQLHTPFVVDESPILVKFVI